MTTKRPADPTIGERAHKNAVDHGFYEDYQDLMQLVKRHAGDDLQRLFSFVEHIWLSHRLMLITSELAEGLEAIRDGNYQWTPRSGGLIEELADADIRIRDLAQHLKTMHDDECVASFGDSLYPMPTFDDIVADKQTYNEGSTFKHGRSL